MNTPKVSIIIPVYQVENFLERAVDSALAQTLEEKEIILVDDGSTDSSPAICDRYAQEHPDQIRVIHQENAGLGMARNAGIDASRGEYLLFMDSDDTIEPDMCGEMYRRAADAGDEIVMCDVRIIYVGEDRTSTVSTYPRREIDLADYIANGSNITYSVNKLFARSVWEGVRYEKMLFEDIALIPALVTRHPRIGYVPKPFYNYYRRPDTLSTSPVGATADIVRAFRIFLSGGGPRYREEIIYCIAKQLLWNMTQSRPLFQADFITFLQEHRQDFLLNPHIAADARVKKLLDFLKKEVIPDRIICPHIGRPIPEEYREEIRSDFPYAELIDADETYFPAESLPESVRDALHTGKTAYAEEYIALRILSERGGIVLMPEMRANLNLIKLRLNTAFFGFEGEETLTAGCFGAVAGHYAIQAPLDSYEGTCIHNRALLPLKNRLRDFLILNFHLKPNGRKQLLKHEIQIYLPGVLAYDMKDGENCCKRADLPAPEGFEVIGESALKMWSDRILENWALYKQALGKLPAAERRQAAVPPPTAGISPAELERALDRRTQEVMDAYEHSTSWRLTKPIRALGRIIHRGGKKQ